SRLPDSPIRMLVERTFFQALGLAGFSLSSFFTATYAGLTTFSMSCSTSTTGSSPFGSGGLLAEADTKTVGNIAKAITTADATISETPNRCATNMGRILLDSGREEKGGSQ